MIETKLVVDDKSIPITPQMRPTIGFVTLKEMELWAQENSTWEPAITKLKVNGVDVWCIKMYGANQVAMVRLYLLKHVSGRYKQFFEMPLSQGEFKVFQDGDSVSISRLDVKIKKHITIATFYRVFEPLNDLATWIESK